MTLDLDVCIERVREGTLLTEKEMRLLCDRAKDVFIQESNIVPVSSPVSIAGDLHGQFFDLLKLIDVAGGEPPAVNYIFMGDFVDRGHHSVETITYLLLLKVKYFSHVVLLRGNHETRQVSFSYGFYEEINRKYGNSNTWTELTNLFDYMPICALVDNKILCVHGGLSPKIKRID